MREKDGKTFGFVRFTDLNDQREALIHMNGFNGLGEKPIKVPKGDHTVFGLFSIKRPSGCFYFLYF